VTDALKWAAFVLALGVSLPLIIYTIETSLGLIGTSAIPLAGEAPSTCILIPAHNEAEIISATLAHLTSIIPANARVLIVADNCSDETASLARSQGYEVLERHDPLRRGKGYALAFGREALLISPPHCVIVFDADCRSDAQSIADLSKACEISGSVLQARYVFTADRSLSAKVQISNFALWIKNVVRQRGSSRIGGPAILTGTGMAFPWSVFEKLPLATDNIVEDLALSLHLTKAGHAPGFFEQATVTSAAASQQATLEQRSRWEHGFLAIARTHGLAAVKRGLLSFDWRTLWLGLHLMVPPLALLLTLGLVSEVLLGVIAVSTGYWLPFFTLGSVLLAVLSATFLNWVAGGRQWMAPRSLIFLPLYVLWKLPLYGRFLIGKTATWVRTQRN